MSEKTSSGYFDRCVDVVKELGYQHTQNKDISSALFYIANFAVGASEVISYYEKEFQELKSQLRAKEMSK